MIQTCRKISLPSELSSLNEAEKFIQEFCADCNLSYARRSDVQVAVLAAVSNAIHFGHAEHGPRLFYLECISTESGGVKFIISDSGQGFDFENVPDPIDPLNFERPCGHGIYLMRKLADSCIFRKHGSEVVLDFELGGS